MTEVRFTESQTGELIRDMDDARTSAAFDTSGKRRVVEKKTANFTLTKYDSGKRFIANAPDVGTVGLTAYLPATQLGLEYEFIVGFASSNYAFRISPNASDYIRGGGLTAADDKDVINTAGTDAVGDKIRLLGDGVEGWIITEKIGTWAREG